jgi:hypothetical protein
MNPDEGIKNRYTHKPDMAHKQHGTKRLRGQDKDPSLWILSRYILVSRYIHVRDK